MVAVMKAGITRCVNRLEERVSLRLCARAPTAGNLLCVSASLRENSYGRKSSRRLGASVRVWTVKLSTSY